jgi:hypothetical protein
MAIFSPPVRKGTTYPDSSGVNLPLSGRITNEIKIYHKLCPIERASTSKFSIGRSRPAAFASPELGGAAVAIN